MSSKQEITTNTNNTEQQTTQQEHEEQEEFVEDARSIKCNTLILEYVLYKKVDVLVEDLVRELPFDRENVPVRVRLIINHLNGLWNEVEQDKVDADRSGLIINCVTKLLALAEERKPAFSDMLQEATFSADDYSKKIKKWLTSFVTADTNEQKFNAFQAIVKYFNILGNYIGEPKLYSLTEQPQITQMEVQQQESNETEPEEMEDRITIDSLPEEPCTYLGLKNTGISNSEEASIFITERIFNARKSKPLIERKQQEQTVKPTESSNVGSTQLQQPAPQTQQSNQSQQPEQSQPKKRKSTTKVPSPKKKKLSSRQSDAKRLVIIREFASSEEDEDIPIAKTIKSHLSGKTQRPRSKSDTNGKKRSVFEESSSSSEEETERTLFRPQTKKSSKDRQKKVFWTDDEVNALLKGFKMYGTQWARILAEFKKTFHPNRDSLSLRDKYRNMEKYGQI